MGQPVGQLAVVGQQQQALGVDVEAHHGEDAGPGGQPVEDGGATLGVVGGGNRARQLVEQEVDEAGLDAHGGAVDLDESDAEHHYRIAVKPITETAPGVSARYSSTVSVVMSPTPRSSRLPVVA